MWIQFAIFSLFCLFLDDDDGDCVCVYFVCVLHVLVLVYACVYSYACLIVSMYSVCVCVFHYTHVYVCLYVQERIPNVRITTIPHFQSLPLLIPGLDYYKLLQHGVIVSRNADKTDIRLPGVERQLHVLLRAAYCPYIALGC